MEQAPSLIMNPSSGTSTPRLDPAAAPVNDKEKEGETSSLASTSTITPDTPPKDGDKADEGDIDDKVKAAASDPATPKPTAAEKTARERAFEYGLDRNNFETEVHQVMGTLNSWWGGVKKQSTSALWSLKADVDKAVSQAQADLEHLKTTNIEVVRKERGDDTTPTEKNQTAAEKDIKGKGKEKEVDSAADQPSTSPGSPPLSTANFFSRLSSSTTQLQNTLQTTIQSTIASAQSNPALKNPAQFRDQLAQNLHLNSAKENLQMSMKQAEKLAEEYMKKGDQWVKDAEKWMGEAVKVVPPEEQERRAAGMSWDGSDWYSFTTSVPSRDTKDEVLFEAGGRRSDRQVSGVVLAGSRKDALLRRLREDKDLLLVDPESEDETKERREEFRKWVEEKWEAARTSERELEEGHVGSIRMALVPEQLSDEQFWQRYLFHKHMIEAEEEKRKAVLKASQQGVEEDFSWDDEAESETASEAPAPAAASPTTTIKTPATPPPASDSTTPKPATSEKMPAQPSVAVPASTAAGAKASCTSTSTSPRDSEESYDLVSDQKKSAAQTEDDDSDWE